MAISSGGGSDPKVELYKRDCELVRESCQVAVERKSTWQGGDAKTVAEFEELHTQKENVEKFAQTIFTFYRQLNDRYQDLTHDLAKERADVAKQELKARRDPNQSVRIKQIDESLKELADTYKKMEASVSAVRQVFTKLS